jgi:hypothetical protein
MDCKVPQRKDNIYKVTALELPGSKYQTLKFFKTYVNRLKMPVFGKIAVGSHMKQAKASSGRLGDYPSNRHAKFAHAPRPHHHHHIEQPMW